MFTDFTTIEKCDAVNARNAYAFLKWYSYSCQEFLYFSSKAPIKSRQQTLNHTLEIASTGLSNTDHTPSLNKMMDIIMTKTVSE